MPTRLWSVNNQMRRQVVSSLSILTTRSVNTCVADNESNMRSANSALFCLQISRLLSLIAFKGKPMRPQFHQFFCRHFLEKVVTPLITMLPLTPAVSIYRIYSDYISFDYEKTYALQLETF